MKTRALFLLAAFAALPLLAQEPPAPPEQEQPPSQPALAPQPPQDSPLVAAAKRNKRSKMTSSVVITNNNLVRDKNAPKSKSSKTPPPLPKFDSPAPTAKVSATTPADPPAKPKRKRIRRDDAEIVEGEPEGDHVQCDTCLPILEQDSKTLPVVKAETSTNPPHEVPREALPQVTPKVPEPVPVHPPGR